MPRRATLASFALTAALGPACFLMHGPREPAPSPDAAADATTSGTCSRDIVEYLEAVDDRAPLGLSALDVGANGTATSVRSEGSILTLDVPGTGEVPFHWPGQSMRDLEATLGISLAPRGHFQYVRDLDRHALFAPGPSLVVRTPRGPSTTEGDLVLDLAERCRVDVRCATGGHGVVVYDLIASEPSGSRVTVPLGGAGRNPLGDAGELRNHLAIERTGTDGCGHVLGRQWIVTLSSMVYLTR